MYLKKILILTITLFFIISAYSFKWIFEPSSDVKNYEEILISKKWMKKIAASLKNI